MVNFKIVNTAFLSFSFFFFFEGGPPMQHMEVSRLGGQIGTAAAASLHHSSQECQIVNPLSGARDLTRVLMDTAGFISAEPQGELLLSFPFDR